jgi:aryl-alcohol dehydrogenase-like predicted oxidoreductase
MSDDFTYADLGKTGLRVKRLGLSATYWPGKQTIFKAFDSGINFFFFFGFDRQLVRALRDRFPSGREKFVVATGAYNYIWTRQDIRKAFEKRLRQLNTDYLDFFLFLGVMKEKEFTPDIIEELCRLREEGKVRGIGLSTHNRKFAGRLASEGILDTFMIRYNAAHRGAEQDIFPHLETHNPALISYTATRWRYLIRESRHWPKNKPIPTAPMCYRFVLSNPHVDVCLTAPSNLKQFIENMSALDSGPLSDDEMKLMHDFGDVVHNAKNWFM